YQVWEDEDKIMILTSEGLFEFDPVDLNCYVKTMSIDFKAKSIDVSRKLHVDTLQNIIYCPLLKGLYRINYEKKIVKRLFENTVIEGFLQVSPEEKWVYYDKGVFRWRGEETAPIKGDILSEAMVSYMNRDQNGGYWFSTHNKGVFYTPSLDLKYYTKEDGLPQKNIKEIVNNKQGDVWAIQKEGEYSVIDTHGEIKTFHTSNSTICDVKVEDDTSWIAHSEGFLNIK